MTRTREDQTRLHRLREPLRLHTDLLLLFSWEVDEVVVFSAHQKWNRGFVEPAALSVPLFDAVESRFPCQVEHEEDGDGIVADEGQHVDEFALAAEIPDGEGDFGVADGDCFFHEVDALQAIID